MSGLLLSGLLIKWTVFVSRLSVSWWVDCPWVMIECDLYVIRLQLNGDWTMISHTIDWCVTIQQLVGDWFCWLDYHSISVWDVGKWIITSISEDTIMSGLLVSGLTMSKLSLNEWTIIECTICERPVGVWTVSEWNIADLTISEWNIAVWTVIEWTVGEWT